MGEGVGVSGWVDGTSVGKGWVEWGECRGGGG